MARSLNPSGSRTAFHDPERNEAQVGAQWARRRLKSRSMSSKLANCWRRSTPNVDRGAPMWLLYLDTKRFSTTLIDSCILAMTVRA